MHSTVKPREQWSREEVVGFYLHQLALYIDPQHGRLTELADAIEVHSYTVGRWKTQGYVPIHQVRRLQRRYGKKLVPEDELCPPEYRAS